MKPLPILQDCPHRRDFAGRMFCVHWQVGERNAAYSTAIDATWCKVCKVAGNENKRPRQEPTPATVRAVGVQRETAPQHGPGTEATAILKDANCKEPLGCDCKAVARWMNTLGVEGCKANIEEIVKRMNRNKKLMGIFQLAKCGAGLAAMGIYGIRQLVEEAIRRANHDT